MPMHAPAGTPDVWSRASSRKLLALTKLLGVERQIVAHQIGVSPTTVWFWDSDQRPIPAKYRPRLLEWTLVAWQQALERHQKAVQALPTDALKVAAIEAFHAPFIQWSAEVLYEDGVVEERVRTHLRRLRDYLDQPRWSASDVEQMQGLVTVLTNQLQILREMTAPEDTGA